MIEISRKQSIYELAMAYPIIKDVMADLGFKDILKAGMLQTMGKVMTLEKGARMKQIPMNTIITRFQDEGFELK